jgi:hypothetical protein
MSSRASRYRLSASGTFDRLRKIDMAQHCKWIAYGTDGLGGKGRTRMRPKLHLPVFGRARFPNHWCHGILVVSRFEGCVVSHRSNRE